MRRRRSNVGNRRVRTLRVDYRVSSVKTVITALMKFLLQAEQAGAGRLPMMGRRKNHLIYYHSAQAGAEHQHCAKRCSIVAAC